MTALEHLHNLRDKFVRTVAAMDSVLLIWQGESPEVAVAQLPPPIVQAELPAPRPRKVKPPKAAAEKSWSRVPRADVAEWLAGSTGPITREKLAAQFGCDVKNASQMLARACIKGTIRRVTTGIYEAAGKPNSKAAPRPSPKVNRMGGQAVSSQYDAVVEVLEAEPGTWLTAKEIEARISGLYPQLVETASKCSDLRVRLIDLAGNGKVQRRGIGSAAGYRSAGRVKADAGDSDLTITVPRELE